MKICSVCRQSKDMDSFHNYKASNDGKMYRCKSCDYEARKKWRLDNPERSQLSARSRRLKHVYGITLDEYYAMLSAQEGCCAICGLEENKSALISLQKNISFAVDHCHVTNKIRGLLCNQCNRALGMFGDNKDILKKALDYLNKH